MFDRSSIMKDRIDSSNSFFGKGIGSGSMNASDAGVFLVFDSTGSHRLKVFSAGGGLRNMKQKRRRDMYEKRKI